MGASSSKKQKQKPKPKPKLVKPKKVKAGAGALHRKEKFLAQRLGKVAVSSEAGLFPPEAAVTDFVNFDAMDARDDAKIEVHVHYLSNDTSAAVTVNPERDVFEELETQLEMNKGDLLRVLFGNNDIERGETFEEMGIENDSRLGIWTLVEIHADSKHEYEQKLDDSGLEDNEAALVTSTTTSNAFAWCNRLTSVKIAEGVTEIPGGAFSDCKMLTQVVLPNGIVEINAGAFGYCYALDNVVIPDSLRIIGERAFNDCKSLISVSLGNVKTIGENAFAFCNSLERVEIPYGVHEIKSHTFFSCNNLTKVVIPSSVERIEGSAFKRTALTEVTVPPDCHVTEGAFPEKCFQRRGYNPVD